MRLIMGKTSVQTPNELNKPERLKTGIKIIWIILITAVILSVSVNIFHFLAFPKQESQITPLEVSGYTDIADGNYKAADGATDTTEIVFDYGKISPGIYHGIFEYDTEKTQTLSFSSIPSAYLEAGDLVLDHRLHQVSFHITVHEPLKNFKITASYDGEKDFSIKPELNKDRILYIRNIVTTVLICTLIGTELFLLSKHPKAAKRYLLILTMSVIAFVPYLLEGLNSGHDFPFHYIRIEGIANGLRDGQFPVYLQSNWLSDHGYPAALFYGDILLYIPALLRLAGYSFDTAFKIFVFLINVLTSFTAFISFRKIFRKEKISWVLAFAWLCAPYRLVDIYVRCAVGEYCAMAFLPLVCAGFYGIVKTDTGQKDQKQEAKTYIRYLSVGMAGILLTHLVTTVMTAVMLVAACLLLIKKVLNLSKLKAFFTAAVKCVILSAVFLVPFVDFYFSNDLDINHNIDTQIPAIQSSGVQAGEFFTFFKDIFGKGHENSDLGDRLYLSPGLTLIITIAAAVICICKGKSTKMLGISTIMSVFALFLSSNLFPYNAIAYRNRLGIFLSQIQFPWRFLSMASILTVLIMGEILMIFETILNTNSTALHPEIKRYILPCVLSIIAFSVFLEASFISSSYSSEAKRNLYLNTNDIEVGTVLLDHGMRYESDPEYFIKDIEAEDASVELLERKGPHLRLHCRTGNTSGAVILPVTNYKGYRIVDEYGQEYNIYENWNKEISFMIGTDFDGIINVFFQPPWYWKASAALSLLYMLFTALCCIGAGRTRQQG